MKKIAIIQDSLINTEYTLMSVNSQELAKSLKDNLSSKFIDYNKFNNDLLDYNKKPKAINLPVEVYEYQNFFLLEKENSELILLDGFRRLLWNETVSHQILVRVYKEKDMTTETILKLLVSLNHTKFFGGIGNFYDRGFALSMYTIFNIDITKIYNSFNGYLTVDEPKYSYSTSRLKQNEAAVSTLDKVTNINFISDMKFLETISDSNTVEMDDVFGSFISNLRTSHPDIIFNSTDFISKVKQNQVLLKQIEAFKKSKNSSGNDIGNKMFEMFSNILLNKTDKSFAEREAEIKDAILAMKKEKTWFNYTANKKIGYEQTYWARDKQDKGYDAIGVLGAIMNYKEKHNKFPKVKVFVYPSENPLLKEGIYDDFEITGFSKETHLMSTTNILTIKRGNITLKRKMMSDNKYDLSYIQNDEFGYNRKSNDVVLFIENIF